MAISKRYSKFNSGARASVPLVPTNIGNGNFQRKNINRNFNRNFNGKDNYNTLFNLDSGANASVPLVPTNIGKDNFIEKYQSQFQCQGQLQRNIKFFPPLVRASRSYPQTLTMAISMIISMTISILILPLVRPSRSYAQTLAVTISKKNINCNFNGKTNDKKINNSNRRLLL